MKLYLVIGSLLVALALGACGGGSGSDDSATAADGAGSGVTEVPGTKKPPPLDVPPGPPPKEVVIRDVKKGHGVEIEPEQGFTTNYISLDWRTGDRVEDYWQSESFQWCWGTDQLTQGWEIGLEGMRVGGQRELIVPSRLAYGSGVRVYMVELLSVG